MTQLTYFIGGPRDGQRMRIENRRDYIELALQGPMSPVTPNAGECVMTVEKFVYCLFDFYRGITVYVPESWLAERDPTEYVLQQLLRGYVGRPER